MLHVLTRRAAALRIRTHKGYVVCSTPLAARRTATSHTDHRGDAGRDSKRTPIGNAKWGLVVVLLVLLVDTPLKIENTRKWRYQRI
mmetsp:Transcript_11275/g.28843  ORF Transcript_11275/g.28843 Transcript_11275/m.28843 type:complete len:86 (-) Transcript_11275:6-263(-)